LSIDIVRTKRKRDIVTVLAVSLFVVIVLLELLIVIWLPVQLRSEQFWERDSAYQEMIALEDFLRGNFVGVIKNCKGKKGLERVEGEVTVVTLCLDDIARYLRMYGSSLNRNQIRDIYIKLQGFEQIFNSMKKLGEFYTRKEQIDSKGFIARLALKNRIKIPVAENKKNDEKK